MYTGVILSIINYTYCLLARFEYLVGLVSCEKEGERV